MQRGRGRGRAQHRAQPQPALVVVVDLDDALRGIVIGAQGATVKATQKQTRAQIRAPRRGEPGPVTVSGETVGSVLQACCLIGRQTRASSACICTIPTLGALAATLHATHADDSTCRLLFEATGASGAAAFVAYVLPPLPPDVSHEQLAQIKDDLLFSVGAPPDETYGTVEGLGDRELFVYGVGPGTQFASSLHLLLQQHVYTPEGATARAAAQAEAASATRPGNEVLDVQRIFECTASRIEPAIMQTPITWAEHTVVANSAPRLLCPV